MESDQPCPCHSGKKYFECCEPFHRGLPPPTPEALMRSRYSAYALNLPNYIIATTDKKGPQYNPQKKLWKKEIAAFSRNNTFNALTIVSTTENTVEFIATLSSGLLHETSTFTKKGNQWLYNSGKVAVK